MSQRLAPECSDCKSLRKKVEGILKRLKELEDYVASLNNERRPNRKENSTT